MDESRRLGPLHLPDLKQWMKEQPTAPECILVGSTLFGRVAATIGFHPVDVSKYGLRWDGKIRLAIYFHGVEIVECDKLRPTGCALVVDGEIIDGGIFADAAITA